jgi:steroid 5-alpha reductase family enzyme
MNQKQPDLSVIAIIYLFIAVAGVLTWFLFRESSYIKSFLMADIAMTIVAFIFSIWKRNSSVYDAYWSVIPFYFIVAWVILEPATLTIWSGLIYLTLSIWSWRLTLNWARSWDGFRHEDWRYRNLARQTGKMYPIVNFLGIHLFPTIMVFLCMWPLFSIPEGGDVNMILCISGVSVASSGIYLEYIADNQLAAFRKLKTGKLLSTGIWAKARHPNYLGEILFWLGMAICGISFGAAWYSLIGIVALTLMFIFVSIPLKEKHMAARYPGCSIGFSFSNSAIRQFDNWLFSSSAPVSAISHDSKSCSPNNNAAPCFFSFLIYWYAVLHHGTD